MTKAFALTGAVAVISVLLQGCGAGTARGTATTVSPAPAPAHRYSGSVYGGQQPVANSVIGLFAATSSGYGAAGTSLLTQAVLTDANGNFALTGLYNCTAGQQIVITATGGNPGGGSNPNLVLMAALGDCANLNANTFISVNELTTVAAAYALSPFMTGPAALGTSAGNVAGLVRAFNSAAKLANSGNGSVPGPLLAAGAVAPIAELNTLADVLASCVNSTGGTAGSNTPCGQLFTEATPPAGVAPADTLTAALDIARNPANNVSALFALSGPTAPFQPQLSRAPTDWTVSINYTAGGFSAPNALAVDASGRVWFPNTVTSTMTVLTQTGTPAALLTGNGLSQPQGVAFDAAGKAWVTNGTGNSVSTFNADGSPATGSPFLANGGLSAPNGLAFDALGHLWIANTGSSTLTELNADGTPAQSISSIPSLATVVIDPR